MSDTPLLRKLQREFVAGSVGLLSLVPMLLIQGQITRWKVGLLPDAKGPKHGSAGDGEQTETLLVLGESTVAGLGARDHERALAGRFAHYLGSSLGKRIEWQVLGKNGVTARRTIEELVPEMPKNAFDHVLLGLGGNDVMKLSSPRKWRNDMRELIGIIRRYSPDSTIYMSNCPMIVMSPIMPEPIKSILWRLSQMHDANAREFTREFERVHYFPQPVDVPLEGFFADGLHPSEQGYDDWSRAMVDRFMK